MLVRREDRVERVLDQAAADDQRQPLVQRRAAGFERGQPDRGGQAQRGVGQHLERQLQTLDDFTLVVGILAGQPEYPAGARVEKLLVVVPEATGFRGATEWSGDRIHIRREAGYS